MNTENSDRDRARAALGEVQRRRVDVRASDTVRRRVLLSWAALLLVFLPLFDLIPKQTAGIVFTCAVAVGAVLTRLYASRQRVVAVGGTRRYVVTWVLWTAWYVVLIVALVTVGRHLWFAWTVGGVLAAAPLVAAALFGGRR